MNNEPVVWMSEVEGGTMYTNYEYPEAIPLYTHPVKELTDEKITEIYNEILIHDKKSSIKFARAILRKASEK